MAAFLVVMPKWPYRLGCSASGDNIMKTKIDNLVSSIQYDLEQAPHTVQELAVFFQIIGADGLSKAIKQRDILRCWAADMSQYQYVRDYAQQRLKELPVF